MGSNWCLLLLIILPRSQPRSPTRDSEGRGCLWTTSDRGGRWCVTAAPGSGQLTLEECTGKQSQLWIVKNKHIRTATQPPACLSLYNYDPAAHSWKVPLIAWACAKEDDSQKWVTADDLPAAVQWLGGSVCVDFDNVHAVIGRQCRDGTPLWRWDCHPEQAGLVPHGGGDAGRCSGPGCGTPGPPSSAPCPVTLLVDVYGLKCLSVAAAAGDPVVEPCTGEDRQRWQFADGYLYSAAPVHGSRVCLTVQGGLALQVWPCTAQAPMQRWTRYFDAFVSASSGLCLSVEGGVAWTTQRQAVVLNPCGGLDTQRWKVDCGRPSGAAYRVTTISTVTAYPAVAGGPFTTVWSALPAYGGPAGPLPAPGLAPPAAAPPGPAYPYGPATAAPAPAIGTASGYPYGAGPAATAPAPAYPYSAPTTPAPAYPYPTASASAPSSGPAPAYPYASGPAATPPAPAYPSTPAPNGAAYSGVVATSSAAPPSESYAEWTAPPPLTYPQPATAPPPAPAPAPPPPPPAPSPSPKPLSDPPPTGQSSATGTPSDPAFQGCSMRPYASPSQCLTPTGDSNRRRLVVVPCDSPDASCWDYDGENTMTCSSQCLNIEGGVQGTELTLWPCNNAANQQFVVSGEAVRHPASGRFVVWAADGTDRVLLSPSAPEASQKWTRRC